MDCLRTLPLLAAAAITLNACTAEKKESAAPAASEAAKDASDPIASAISAAPEAVARGAAVVTMGADGSIQTLRGGTNGFTCMPDNPATPGPDPMCMDANAMDWVTAWIGKKTPPDETPGIMYMLAGGTDASNTDPYATKPAEGDDWIETGPHMMVVGSAAALRGYPSGPKPDTSVPYVMFAGTPYAHLMIPVK